MTWTRLAAALTLLPLACACDGRGGANQAGVAGEIACPDMPAAAAPKPPPRADRTMIGQPIKLPAPPQAVQAVVSVKCFAPGATIARHKHPWQRYVYLESGSLRVAFDFPVPQVKSFTAGDLLVESTDTWHSVEVGNAPARLLVIDQVPATVPPTDNVIPWPVPGGKGPAGGK
jgi:quercetin dioxygenase-like cupin family protein